MSDKLSEARFELMRALLKNLLFDSLNNTLTSYGQFVLQSLSKHMAAHDDKSLISILQQLNATMSVKSNVNLLINKALLAFKKYAASDSYSVTENNSYGILRDTIVEQQFSMRACFNSNPNFKRLIEIRSKLLSVLTSVGDDSSSDNKGLKFLILKTLAVQVNKLVSMIEAREFDRCENIIDNIKQVLLRFNNNNYTDFTIPELCQELSELVVRVRFDISINRRGLGRIFISLSNLNSGFYQPVIHEMDKTQSKLPEYQRFKSAFKTMEKYGHGATDNKIKRAVVSIMNKIKQQTPELFLLTSMLNSKWQGLEQRVLDTEPTKQILVLRAELKKFEDDTFFSFMMKFECAKLYHDLIIECIDNNPYEQVREELSSTKNTR